MPKKETKKLVIILLLIDLIIISFFVFLYYFTKNLITESVNKESEIKIELKKEDTRALMKNDLILGKMYQEKLMDYMIPKSGTVDFIKNLEQLILNSGLKSDIKTVSNEPYDKGNTIGLELIRIKMNVIGEWKNVQFFLNELENYPLKITINNASFNKSSDNIVNNKKIPQWSVNFEFTVVKIKDTK